MGCSRTEDFDGPSSGWKGVETTRTRTKCRKRSNSKRWFLFLCVTAAAAILVVAAAAGGVCGVATKPIPTIVKKKKQMKSTTKSKKKGKEKDKPPRVQFYAREGVPEFGTVVSGPSGYGEWRSVPGFSADKLHVSELGFYQVYSQGKWQNPSAGSEMRQTDGTMRHKATVDDNDYFVYHLVLRAFKGPQPRGTTADHGDRNTSNNSATNLEWRTHSEQNGNQRTVKKVQSTASRCGSGTRTGRLSAIGNRSRLVVARPSTTDCT